MKKATSILLILALLCTFFLVACDADEDSTETKASCSLCGKTYRNYAFAQLELCAGQHGVGACIQKAPCGISEHYVLTGTTTDKNGVSHTICPYCGEYLCVGEHGIGVCYQTDDTQTPGEEVTLEPAPCGIEGHNVIKGKTKDQNGVDHGACEYCGGWLCQGEHGVGKCVSTDATLKSLTFKCGGQILALGPGFNSQTFAYTAGYNRTTYVGEIITVSAVANDPAATVSAPESVTLERGNNTITITVTAPDKVTTLTYTVTIGGSQWDTGPQRDPDTPPLG